MKKILNFGSLNIDKVYDLENIVAPGETVAARSYQESIGGKGLNQSVALKRAGADLYHAGFVGSDGEILTQYLLDNKINSYVKTIEGPSGHAIIQVDAKGSNSIIVVGGANKKIDTAYIDKILENFQSGDYLVLQNEINNLAYIIKAAKAKGMEVVLNPSPIDPAIADIDLDDICILIINESEGQSLSQQDKPEDILRVLKNTYKDLKILLTLGPRGGIYTSPREEISFESFAVDVIDTTAAGDTFLGYFVAGLAEGKKTCDAISQASLAAALTCTKKGAAPSIPVIEEVLAFARENDLEDIWKK